MLKVTKAILVILSVAYTLVSCGSVQRRESQEPLDLSRESFIREMVIASETETTKHFSDHEGSYHVEKLDLIEGVRSLFDSTTKDVDAVLIIGPSGALWQYNVITVIDSTDADGTVSVNHIVFPHARITIKSTRVLERVDYQEILARIYSNPLLSNVEEEDKTAAGEWALSFTIVKFGVHGNVRVIREPATNSGRESQEMLYKAVYELIDGDKTVVTYD